MLKQSNIHNGSGDSIDMQLPLQESTGKSSGNLSREKDATFSPSTAPYFLYTYDGNHKIFSVSCSFIAPTRDRKFMDFRYL